MKDGKVIAQGTHNPPGVIHVCSGNGGPPSPSACGDYKKWNKCIADPYSYTRLVAHNASDLTWTQARAPHAALREPLLHPPTPPTPPLLPAAAQVSNKDSSVIDEWTLHQDNHGPFPATA